MRAFLTNQFLFLAIAFTPAALGASNDAAIASAAADAIVLPEPIADPLEPINRGLWEVNKGVMLGVIQPTGKAYRLVVPKPLRVGIRNAGRNLGYPRRVVNNLLQERWTGARDETYRFFYNSVFGLGGLFDVGKRWGVSESEADFGQTFGTWGWRPHAYLMLPIAGPSNERDAVGSVLDSLVNPLTYFPPYSYVTYGITYNNLTDTVDEYVRLSKTDYDPYYVLRYAWTLRRESRGADLSFEGAQDAPSLETLQSVFFTFKNPKFPVSGQTHHVRLSATGEKLPFTCWLQPSKAPLIYLAPGIGSHRLGAGALAMAELLHREGFSVATVSSTFNHEFIERASSQALPGYTPADAADLRQALGEIDRFLEGEYPRRLGPRALMGYSMGGFHALYLAATEETNRTGMQFDRYVAVDAPVQLNYAISQLDDYFRAALAWPAAERTQQIEKTFAKVAALSSQLDKLTAGSVIPLSSTESKFLIGLAFRLSLRDMIFLSQTRTNQGVLKQPIDLWRREPVYREILQLSFSDYLEKFVTPYYRTRGIDLGDRERLRDALDLRGYTAALKTHGKVRVIENANDPLLGQEGLAWLRENFAAGRLTVFEGGGHLGNLGHPAVQRAIVDSVADLRDRSLSRAARKQGFAAPVNR